MSSPLVSLTCTFRSLFSGARFIIIFACSIQLIACSASKKINSQTQPDILSDSNLLNAHVGFSIYDPSTNKYLYSHQADKYFIPASNTKLFTCYAAMKHLGDSLVGLRYAFTDLQKVYASPDQSEKAIMIIKPTGDPTFLHSNYKEHPVYRFLNKKTYYIAWVTNYLNAFEPWGNGWAWNDYMEDYMAERNVFPIYGNTVQIEVLPIKDRFSDDMAYKGVLFKTQAKCFDSLINHMVGPLGHLQYSNRIHGELYRSLLDNIFWFYRDTNYLLRSTSIPFITKINRELLQDTLSEKPSFSEHSIHKSFPNKWTAHSRLLTTINFDTVKFNVIHSQPTDSLLKPMMHRSDNFFAEQTLLMVSNEMTGVMNDSKIIDSLLKTDLKDLPQTPRWVDGSGLSRYNLFSPNDMIHVLNKMKNEFDWNRITTILPTGGEGTLSNYYINLKDRIFAKTGTLSNNIALSGFLITKQNKTLIFSVLVNNHMGNTTQIRRAVEKFLVGIAEKH
jgi:serine-type D-Ala-D-Ala carboxypeptidase/endopeptidase (penicillin-binding protein 4)